MFLIQSLPRKFLKTTLVTLNLCLLLSTSASAKSFETFHFQPGETVRTSLSGSVSRSIYETRSYETTCYSTEYRTEYREVCTPRTREECSSHPVCRDVMRPICTSSGCTDYLTRECTTQTSCSTVSDGQSCHTESISVPYEVPYSCTQTETVKVGEEFSHTEQGDFEFVFSGDGAESASDEFRVQVANGLDAGAGFQIDDVKTSGKYLFFLKRLNPTSEDRTSGGARVYNAKFNIHAVSIDRLIRENQLKIVKMKFSAQSVEFDLKASPAPDYTVDLTILKDRLIGGSKTLFSGRISKAQMTTQANPDGTIHYTIPLAQFGLSFNRRPHIVRLAVGIDLSAIFEGERLLNTHDEQKLRSKLNASRGLKKKVR